MILYGSGAYGLGVIFRLHGSAAFKALIPAVISTGFYYIIYFCNDSNVDASLKDNWIDHPYPFTVLIMAFTFVLTFKASFSYSRYWEACQHVHQMQSKWLDCAMELASFHLQSVAYDSVKPPAFGSYPEIKSVVRERERINVLTIEERNNQLDTVIEGTKAKSMRSRFRSLLRREKASRNLMGEIKNAKSQETSNRGSDGISRNINAAIKTQQVTFAPKFAYAHRQTMESDALGSNASTITQVHGESHVRSVVVMNGGMRHRQPSLFLQEAAHLVSLLSAVALSTLRNDIETAESPLCEFVPGAPWPPVDPDDEDAQVKKQYYTTTSMVWQVIRYLFFVSRTEESRTLYNAARPMRVLGGVSDAEISSLQAARGPLAKVALVSMWLHEFIAREYLAGSTGQVAPPIISRLFQFTSDGMIGYNQARKIAYIPFPFPHAQMTTFYEILITAFMPILMISLIQTALLGGLINFFTVLCFTGLQAVAQELENPFKNVPNDIPLNNFQAQFNESLLTMHAGYHPEAWWEIPGKVETPQHVLEKLSEPIEEEEPNEENGNNNEVTGEPHAEVQKGGETHSKIEKENTKELLVEGNGKIEEKKEESDEAPPVDRVKRALFNQLEGSLLEEQESIAL